MRRHLGLLLPVVLLVLLLALPASASAAKSWRIRDRSGHVRGTAVLLSNGRCRVSSSQGGGLHAGDISRTQYGWRVTISGDDSYEQVIYKAPSGYYWFAGGGKAVRREGVWMIKKLVMEGEGSTPSVYRRVGSVSAGCPGQFALGAAWLLLW